MQNLCAKYLSLCCELLLWKVRFYYAQYIIDPYIVWVSQYISVIQIHHVFLLKNCYRNEL